MTKYRILPLRCDIVSILGCIFNGTVALRKPTLMKLHGKADSYRLGEVGGFACKLGSVGLRVREISRLLGLGTYGMAILALSACEPDPTTINYRITVEVEVDGVVHSGSSVIQTIWFGPSLVSYLGSSVAPFTADVIGEAVFVDLGPHGNLFVLLTGAGTKNRDGKPVYSPDAIHLPLSQFSDRGPGSMTPQTLKALAQRKGTSEMSIASLPMFVRFNDIHDPRSVELVDPSNLAASFGPGVRFLRATISTTTDPITRGVENRLDWMRAINGKYLSGSKYSGIGPYGLTLAGEIPSSYLVAYYRGYFEEADTK